MENSPRQDREHEAPDQDVIDAMTETALNGVKRELSVFEKASLAEGLGGGTKVYITNSAIKPIRIGKRIENLDA